MESNKNTEITVESLVASEQFQNYCLQPNIADQKYWKQWLEDNEEHTTTFEEAKELVLQLSEHVSEETIGGEWENLKKQLELQSPKQRIIFSKQFIQKQVGWGIAASFLIFLTLFWVWKISQPIPLQQITTAFGETQNIVLPDGSQVIVNANSELKYAKDWRKANKREVWLKGEAYFEVLSDKDLPFSVYTQKAEVKVLGTSFNVWQRSNDFNVTLVEGKVQLSLPNQFSLLNMKAGEQIHITNNEIQQTTADVEVLTAWRTGKLIFKNASIQSIIQRLQNEYGWTIHVKRSALLERKVNASIQKNNPELLLEALREIYELDIQKLSKGVYEIR